MQKRAVRWIVVALLLAAGAGAAMAAYDSVRRIGAREADRHAADAIVERMLPAAAGIDAARQSYVDHGARDEAALARVSGWLRQLAGDAAALRPRLHAPAGIEPLGTVDRVIAELIESDRAAQQNLTLGESLLAADVLFGTSGDQLAALPTALRALQRAEAAEAAAARQALEQRAWTIVGGAALLWTVGLLLLARVPGGSAPSADGPAVAAAPVAALEPDSGRFSDPGVAPAAEGAVDLPAAAALCTEIARTADAAAIPDLLRRAAGLLDASGLIIWMGAGEELFPATAHGYDQRIIGRLGPIARGAENATAAAWRSGELRTVASSGAPSGAIVAPLFDSRGCIGVLAVEVRGGREHDAATQAVTAVVAAQFSTVLTAWPAASVAAPPAQADRQSAAS